MITFRSVYLYCRLPKWQRALTHFGSAESLNVSCSKILLNRFALSSCLFFNIVYLDLDNTHLESLSKFNLTSLTVSRVLFSICQSTYTSSYA